MSNNRPQKTATIGTTIDHMTMVQEDGSMTKPTTDQNEDCECQVDRNLRIHWCSLHKAAPQMLGALRELVRAWDERQLPVSDRMEAAIKDADAAVRAADGETNREYCPVPIQEGKP